MAKPNRGDTQALPGYFFPNHSSLFPKKPSPFHMGLYFGKVPTVNPSVKNQRFLPAPFGKGACGQCPQPFSHDSFLRIVTSLTRPVSLLRCSRCVDQSPPCQRGVVWRSQTGGIPRHCLGTSSLITLHYSLKSLPFPHGFVLWESSNCESLSHGCAVPAPFHKGAFFRPVSFYCAIPGFFVLSIDSVG